MVPTYMYVLQHFFTQNLKTSPGMGEMEGCFYFIKVYSVLDTLMHSFCRVSSEGVGVFSHLSHVRKNLYIIAGCMEFLY
jgi:hypothetical protein